MKANSSTRMKMSMANLLVTTSGSTSTTTAKRPSHSALEFRNRPFIASPSSHGSAGQTARPKRQRQEQHQEDHDQSGIGADELNAERFGNAHHEARYQR